MPNSLDAFYKPSGFKSWLWILLWENRYLKNPNLPGVILDVSGRTRNRNQSIYLIPASSLGNFRQQLYWKIILIHSFVCWRIWISQVWSMMTKQHLFFYFLYLEGAEIILKPGYSVILVKFVPSGNLSLDLPLVFIKGREEKQKRCLFYWSCDIRGFHLRNLLESVFEDKDS